MQNVAEEQQSFVRLFLELLERAYVTKVDLYGGQRVKYVGESVEGDYATVRAKVLTKRGRRCPSRPGWCAARTAGWSTTSSSRTSV